jgi:carboxymethylenebutenolidase
MPGSMVTFAANGHTADGYLSLPPSGKGPGLLVIQEWWGLVDHIKTLTDRFAAEGFVALAPDMYHGERTTSPDQAGKLLMARRSSCARMSPSRRRKSVPSASAWAASLRSTPRRSTPT